MSNKNFDINLIKIDNIVIINATIDNSTGITSLDNSKYIYDLTHSFELAMSSEQKKMRLIFNCKIKTIEKITEKEIPVNANFDIAFIFYVENLHDLTGAGSQHDNDSDLIVTISNIAYSTSRGIIFTRCQGTILKNVILPIMATNRIIKMLQSNE